MSDQPPPHDPDGDPRAADATAEFGARAADAAAESGARAAGGGRR